MALIFPGAFRLLLQYFHSRKLFFVRRAPPRNFPRTLYRIELLASPPPSRSLPPCGSYFAEFLSPTSLFFFSLSPTLVSQLFRANHNIFERGSTGPNCTQLRASELEVPECRRSMKVESWNFAEGKVVESLRECKGWRRNEEEAWTTTRRSDKISRDGTKHANSPPRGEKNPLWFTAETIQWLEHSVTLQFPIKTISCLFVMAERLVIREIRLAKFLTRENAQRSATCLSHLALHLRRTFWNFANLLESSLLTIGFFTHLLKNEKVGGR